MSKKNPVCKLDLYRQLNLPLPDVPPADKTQRVQCRRAMGDNEGPICKRDILKQMGLPIPGERATMDDMEAMVASMELEIRTIQSELDGVQAERRQLEMQKRLIHCTAPTIAANHINKEESVTLLPPPPPPPLPGSLWKTEKKTQATKQKAGLSDHDNEEAELNDLNERYTLLVDDYNKKVEEVSALRVEVEGARRMSIALMKKYEQSDAIAEDLEARLRAFEDDSIKGIDGKERTIELTHQLAMAERMFEKSFDELEDLQGKVTCQTRESDEFRRKYLDAEQCAEEQRQKIEMLELERTSFGGEVTNELQKIKEQFQSKLEEMSMLPDLIRKTSEKLEEVEQIKEIAEKNCVVLSMNLDEVNEEKDAFEKQLDEVNRHRSMNEAEKSSMKSFLTDGEKKVEETKTENKNLKLNIARLEEQAILNERKYEEAVEESKQLQEQLETLRQHSARQVAKTKDKLTKTRHTLQDQISDLEKKLATTRASEKTAVRERDEIRKKMQAEIIQLNQSFDEAQGRIRSIQSHVNYLKTSNTSSF